MQDCTEEWPDRVAGAEGKAAPEAGCELKDAEEAGPRGQGALTNEWEGQTPPMEVEDVLDSFVVFYGVCGTIKV